MQAPDPKDSGRTVATSLSGMPSSQVITRDSVFTRAGLDASWFNGDLVALAFWSMTFIDALRDALLENDGRWLHTVRGEGFRLLGPDDSVEVLANKGERDARREIDKARRRIRKMRCDVLTSEGRRTHTRADMRLGMLSKGIQGE